jgi:hypothetical protein
MKRISFMILFSLFFFLAGANLLQAQVDTVLYEQFDNGQGQWATGWIDAANATATFSIDSTGKLSGKYSYKGVITSAQMEMYRIQRIHDLPLTAGYQYKVSFLAVADSDALVNLLFELSGSPYTKRIDDTVSVTDTPQAFTYTMTATESVPTNQIKFMLGGAQNSGRTIWLDSIIVTRIPDPALVTKWGETSLGFAWDVLNDSSTAAGDASMSGTQPMSSNGASLLGGFDTLKPTMDKAVVASGQLQFVGSPGESYTALRFALTYADSLTLNNQYTDTAMWVKAAGKGYYGYEFTPRSGGTDKPNGSGGSGSVWTIINGNWSSTYSNGGAPLTYVDQAPRLAVITEGTYNWAVSVQQINDTTNEVRWSLVKTDNSYWFGGTVMAPAVTDKFNNVAFWTKDGEQTQFNLMGVRATLGNPITVPEAPWQAYYLDQWGETSLGFAWSVLNDTNTVVGDAGIAGTQPMSSNGASLLGGFGQDVKIPTDKAVIVSGQLKFVGSPGASYTALRFAMTYADSLTLNNQNTDTAMWVKAAGKGYYGYEFTPRSGGTDKPNGSGGSGSIWTIINGNWSSTYSNGGAPLTYVDQAPRLAVIDEGTYNWAISVQQINDTTNEVRWYLEKTHAAGEQSTYWFAGVVDAPAVTNKFNNVAFWTKDGDHTEFDIIAAKIDLGNPITIPPKPFAKFYISINDWGFYGSNRVGGWTLTKGDVDGNVSISGSGPVASNQWSAVRGGFGGSLALSDLPADTALVVTGKMKFVGGGFDGWSGLRFGLFYSDSAGVVDSTADGPMWSGSEAYSTGYLFCPNSGTNDNPTWSGSGGNGSVGGVVNATWLSTNGANNYILSDQKTTNVSGAGTYDFKLTFKDMGSQGTAVGYSISGPSYLLEGHAMDTSSSRPTKFNAINFAVSGGNLSTTGLDITDVLVDVGSPVITGVSDEKNSTLPMTFSLSQNYPNPFNPTTTIKFGLPKAADVSLVVYDILGRKVTELVHGNLTAGYHTVNFNASNLASGVYFYRIQAGDFVSVKKLMLLK